MPNSLGSKKTEASAVHDGPNQVSNPILPATLTASVLVDFASILGMVFGGCCSNVITYEQLLVMSPGIGSALTFSQMLFVSIEGLLTFLTFTPLPQLRPRQIPIEKWIYQVLIITSTGLLNNWAYAFSVPFSILIVFRSAGLPVSMLFGFLFLGRRYTFVQTVSVIGVSLGVVTATLSKANHSITSSSTEGNNYLIGVSMLTISLVLTTILGILQEQTYGKYGPHWREGVFYTHILSLPLFVFLVSDIKEGFSTLSAATSGHIPWWLILFGNLITQLVCVSGVNKLNTRVSSVSTNLVLTARKAISLCFSVWWFGTGWQPELVVGAGMVFLGSLLFTTSGRPKIKKD